MKVQGMARAWLVMVGTTLWLCGSPLQDAVQAADPQAGRWTAGGAIGFLANTPDDTAFALNFNADVFLTDFVSLGPLVQLAFTDDLTQAGFSAQGKYWLPMPTAANRMKLVLQGGIGFVHADNSDSDTSFLIPLGVGLDVRLDEALSLTMDFFLNFTDLDDTEPGGGDDTTVMPGLTFGVRF